MVKYFSYFITFRSLVFVKSDVVVAMLSSVCGCSALQ